MSYDKGWKNKRMEKILEDVIIKVCLGQLKKEKMEGLGR